MRKFVIKFINDYFDGIELTNARQERFSSNIEAISELFACDAKYCVWYGTEDNGHNRVTSLYLHGPNFTVGPTICIYIHESYDKPSEYSIKCTTIIGKMEGLEFTDIGYSLSLTEELRHTSIWKTPEYKDILIRESGLMRMSKSARK